MSNPGWIVPTIAQQRPPVQLGSGHMQKLAPMPSTVPLWMAIPLRQPIQMWCQEAEIAQVTIFFLGIRLKKEVL